VAPPPNPSIQRTSRSFDAARLALTNQETLALVRAKGLPDFDLFDPTASYVPNHGSKPYSHHYAGCKPHPPGRAAAPAGAAGAPAKGLFLPLALRLLTNNRPRASGKAATLIPLNTITMLRSHLSPLSHSSHQCHPSHPSHAATMPRTVLNRNSRGHCDPGQCLESSTSQLLRMAAIFPA
jgi:hypothetical protein